MSRLNKLLRLVLILTAVFNCAILGAQEQIAKLSDSEIDAAFSEIKQNFSESPEEWVFSKVIKQDGKSVDVIFSAAQTVLSTIYPNAKDVIKISDKEAGIIVAKGFLTSSVRTYNAFLIALYRTFQEVKIEVRDGRYKLTLTTKDVQCQCGGKVDPNAFGEATVPLSHYFPYDRDFKKSLRPISWDLIKFVYDAAMSETRQIEQKIAKELSNTEDW